MVALTAGRSAPWRSGDTIPGGLAANAKIFTGALACLSGNYVVKASTALNLKALGVSIDDYDNTGGANDAVQGQFRKGIFRFANSAAGDLIAKGDIGATAYIVDDQTVAKTDGGGTRSAAGKIWDVDSGGVWIDLR